MVLATSQDRYTSSSHSTVSLAVRRRFCALTCRIAPLCKLHAIQRLVAEIAQVAHDAACTTLRSLPSGGARLMVIFSGRTATRHRGTLGVLCRRTAPMSSALSASQRSDDRPPAQPRHVAFDQVDVADETRDVVDWRGTRTPRPACPPARCALPPSPRCGWRASSPRPGRASPRRTWCRAGIAGWPARTACARAASCRAPPAAHRAAVVWGA